MVGWHHGLDGHEFEQAPGAGDRLKSLKGYSQWGQKELDTTEQLNLTELKNRLGFPPRTPSSLLDCRRERLMP